MVPTPLVHVHSVLSLVGSFYRKPKLPKDSIIRQFFSYDHSPPHYHQHQDPYYNDFQSRACFQDPDGMSNCLIGPGSSLITLNYVTHPGAQGSDMISA